MTRPTFEQREGTEPMPQPIALRELSSEFRSMAWRILYECLQRYVEHPTMGGPSFLRGEMAMLLKDYWTYRLHKPIDEFSTRPQDWIDRLKNVVLLGAYDKALGVLEWIANHHHAPYRFSESLTHICESTKLAYLFDNREKIFIPRASEAEGETIRDALSASQNEFTGAHTHIRNSVQSINAGAYADSVRESIHSVESVARTLSPGARTLAPALAELEKKTSIHPALRKGMENIYGFTSDEKGVRHALLEKPQSTVTIDEAIYMLGACAAFVSYLIAKHRAADSSASPAAP